MLHRTVNSLMMKKLLASKQGGVVVFVVYCFCVCALVALPGFLYFYFIKGASLGISLFIGLLIGFFLWFTFDAIFGFVALLFNRGLKPRKKPLSSDEPPPTKPLT
jgi:hypothetical protein